MKKLFLIITLFAFTIVSACAAENQLTTVVLEGNNSGYDIILRTDAITRVKKTIQSDDKITLELKGITSANPVNTLYKNTVAVNSLIVEKSGNDDLKIYIQAPDIAEANIIFDTPATPPVVVTENLTRDKIAWSALAFFILVGVIASTRSLKHDSSILIENADIRQREIEMYRNFKREMASMPSINYNIKSRSPYSTNVIGTRNIRRTIRQFEKVS